MGARSLRINQQKLQRARLVHYEVSSSFSSPRLLAGTGSIPYPPIFLSPSDFDAFTPSPSPLPGGAGIPHHEVSTAAIVGGSVAGVVALAATATIISTVAGKAGLSCLLGPILKLLPALFGPFAKRLQSLVKTLNKLNPARKRRRSNEADDKNEGSADLDVDNIYEILGGSPARASKGESTAVAAHSLTTSPLQNIVKGHVEQLQTAAEAYLVTATSDFAESVELELKKKTEIMRQPVCQQITKIQGYAESLFPALDNVVDTLEYLDSSRDEEGKFKDKEHYVKASTEAGQPEDTMPSMLNEGIKDGADKTLKCHTIASEKLQGPPVLLEEEVVLHRNRGKPSRTTSNVEADELEKEELKHRVLLNHGGKKSGRAYIVESASDAHTELQVLEETAVAPASHKQENSTAASRAMHSMALVPSDTGGGTATSHRPAAVGTMVPVPTKALAPVQGRTMTSATKGKRAGDGVMQASAGKRKRPSNLGHVSFSCEMSAHRLRFFTSCRSGGTYGSSPSSPDHTLSTTNNNNHHNYNYYHSDSIIKTARNPCTSTVNKNQHHNYNYCHNDNLIKATSDPSIGADSWQPSSGHYQLYVPLDNNASHYNLMHLQSHRPSSSLLVRRNTSSASPCFTERIAAPSPTPLVEVIDTKPTSLEILNYGGPFDGVL